MPLRRRRRLSITVLAVGGTILGAVSGYWLGYETLLGAAGANLANYAGDLVLHSDNYSNELKEIRQAFTPSPYEYCSPQEIAVMQAMTFRSPDVKEIGRTRDGKLYCSAYLGRLETPLPQANQGMTLPDGTHLYNDVPLTFAAHEHGTVIELGGVNVVVSPHAFDHWERPYARYMAVEITRDTLEMAQIGGVHMDVKPVWIVSQRASAKGGALYASRCSNNSSVCIVTSESVGEILAGSRPLLVQYCSLGGLAGFGLGLAVGLFYLQRIGLSQQFRRALRKDALRLVYQPVYELPSRECWGAEALTRWSDEEGNPVPPEVFVRIAEDRGLTGELTSFVIRRATAEVGWILRKNPKLTLSINIAPSDLGGDALMMLLNEHVREAGIEPRQIALEVTERSTTDMNILRHAILRLHHAGYQVHIDDFGTGFSSLGYLHELAVDAIKIDQIFTRTIGTQAVTASILPQILTLGETLRLEVIVEGVSTEEQVQYLISTGRRMQAQGLYFGHPMTASQLPKYREYAHEAPQTTHAATEVRPEPVKRFFAEENSVHR